MFLASESDITLFGGSAGCLAASAEYLSETGWRRFDSYSGEKVAEYNFSNDSLEFVQPKEYIKLPCESFKRIKARGLDFTLSPEHRVVYWNEKGSGEPLVISFEEMLNRHEKSRTKGWTGKIKTTFKSTCSGIDLSEGEIRLQVAVQADGRVVKEGKDNYTQMRFSKERKYKRLIEMLNKFNLRYKDNGWKVSDSYLSGKEYEVIVWPSRPTKKFVGDWWNCSQKQLEYITDEVRYWDSSRVDNQKAQSVKYFSKHRENVDFIQYAFHACGYNTHLSTSKRDGIHEVGATLSGNGYRRFSNKDGKQEVTEVQSEDGFKYCFTVDTGMLVVRVNNRVFITGNSGKTFCALLALTKYLDDPKTEASFVRRNYSALRQAGSAFYEAVSLYQELYPGVRIQKNIMRFTFPSGATLKFSHCNHLNDLEKIWKGAQNSVTIVDEVTEFEYEQIIYIMSRARNAKVGYKPVVLWQTNPHAESFLVDWLKDRYLDEYGFPKPEMCNVEMYFHKEGDRMLWYKSLFEAQSVHGFGADNGVTSFRFIPSTVYDNKILMEKNPGYVNKLKMQSTVECNRLLYGNWFARAEHSGLYKREWSEIVEYPNAKANKRVRAWDLASSPPSDQNPNPDWTRGVLISKDRKSLYTIEDMVSIRDRPYKVEELIFATAEKDGKDVIISIPQDPGAQAVSYSKTIQRRLAEKGYTVRLSKPTKSKVTRFGAFSSIAQAGYINVVKNDWTKELLDELESFSEAKTTLKDDIVDCCSDCINILNQSISLPSSLSLPDLSPSRGTSSTIDDFESLKF
jgi:predicted phage terminase large subunit-like protein